MKILAAGLVPKEQMFLHAGYISSMPRSFYLPHNLDVENADKVTAPPLNLNVSKSLQLTDEAPFSTLKTFVVQPPPPKEISAVSNLTFMASGIVLFFCCAGALHMLRRYSQRFAFALLLVLLLISFIGMDAYSAAKQRIDDYVSYPAHTGVAGRAKYKDPYAATLVIMHGLLIDGVINSKAPISSLDQIQKEIAFPTTRLTAGMQHALDNYAVDGWGNPFIISSANKDVYQITSHGPDGKLGTNDDITVRFNKADDGTWDSIRWGMFAQKDGDKLQVYFHRWPGELFEYLNQNLAMQKSGSTLFDVWQSSFPDSQGMERISKSAQWKMVPSMNNGELYLWVTAWKMSGL